MTTHEPTNPSYSPVLSVRCFLAEGVTVCTSHAERSFFVEGPAVCLSPLFPRWQRHVTKPWLAVRCACYDSQRQIEVLPVCIRHDEQEVK